MKWPEQVYKASSHFTGPWLLDKSRGVWYYLYDPLRSRWPITEDFGPYIKTNSLDGSFHVGISHPIDRRRSQHGSR